MSHTLFISDLHLSPERPQIVEVLLGFLAGAAGLPAPRPCVT